MKSKSVFENLWVVLVIQLCAHITTILSDEIYLNMEDVFPGNYDNLQPPKSSDSPTVVRFHVWVLSIDSIDEGSMTYAADIFMSQTWKDDRLKIPEHATNNISNYRLLPLSWLDRMWRPDSFFKNAKQVTFQEMTIPNHYIWLYSDNRILYMVKLTLLLSCAMKFQSYPHDTQYCALKIESLSYTMDDLVFEWEEQSALVVDESIELPQHLLTDARTGHCHHVYSSGNFTCVEVIFTLKRRLGYYIFHTYIPTCLIVIISWISFWIKPEAVPARVTLCVTSLLTLSTQHAQSQKSLPPVSYIKAIDIFMSSCTVFVFSSLMEYAFVNILMAADEKINFSANCYASQNRTINHEVSTKNSRSDDGSSGPTHHAEAFIKKRDRALILDKISRWTFPLSFVILNVGYWTVYLDWE